MCQKYYIFKSLSKLRELLQKWDTALRLTVSLVLYLSENWRGSKVVERSIGRAKVLIPIIGSIINLGIAAREQENLLF